MKQLSCEIDELDRLNHGFTFGFRRKVSARRRMPVAVLAAIVVILACAAIPLWGWQSAQAQRKPVAAVLEASGVIRAEQVLIASEYGGSIASLPLTEGDAVAAGDLIVQLDTALLDAQIAVARASSAG